MKKISVSERPGQDEQVKMHTRPRLKPPRYDLRKPRILEEKDRDHPDNDPDLKKDAS